MAINQTDAPYRHALYYPCIHIHDENWLKGALLGFQQVRRIVPNQFTVKDQAITKPYSELTGPDGQALLQPVYIRSQQVRESQEWLRHKMLERIDQLIDNYSEEHTPPELQSGPEAFEIHVGKILDPELLQLVTSKSLAWPSRQPTEPDSSKWVTMHPTLGSAVMSILALAVARLEGLSIVTSSGETHHELLANREEQVFERLINVPVAPGTAPNADVTVEELAHVVITTGFDLTRLTPAQISELLKEGKDLRAFHRAVAVFVSRIPSGLGPEERATRLKKEAQSVLDEWAKYTDLLPPFAKRALVDSALDKVPDVIKGGIAMSAHAVLMIHPTLLISYAVGVGLKMYRERDSPLRFLNRVNKAVDRSVGSIYVPQWKRLIGQVAN